VGQLTASGSQIDTILRDVDGSKTIMPHDSFHYLKQHAGLVPAKYVTAGDTAEPGPTHMRELRETGWIRRCEVCCHWP
jgi:ABC-type Zn2+ transport system substrate-binding protein/surface adhesin